MRHSNTTNGNGGAVSGIIFDLKKFALHDGPGIRTTVFFKGCPLDCWWCHNPEARKPQIESLCLKRSLSESDDVSHGETVGRRVTVDELMVEIMKDEVFYDQSGGGVTFSGGEPLMQVEFLRELLLASRSRGLHTTVDTSGYAPAEAFDRIDCLVDLFYYDLKIIDEATHQKYTGMSNRLILENFERLCQNGNRVQVRIPMIPGITDTDDNLEDTVRFIKPLSVITEIALLPYNRFGEDKWERFGMVSRLGDVAVPPEEVILARAERLRACGYTVSVGG